MPLRSLKRSLVVALLTAWGVLAPSVASAQGLYPNESVKFVVAFSAGGPTDVVARILGQRLAEKWGRSVVVENHGGAGGNIAARLVARAEPNGYTVLVSTSAFAVNPSLTANAGYSPDSDYRTVIVVGTTPNIIIGAADLKASSLKELIEAAKTERLTYGMPGVGTTPHLSAEKLFKVLGKVDVPAVTFTGGAPTLNAVLGGHVKIACLAMPPAIEHIKNGQIKGLAVLGDKRVPSLPDVPTAIEQGFGDREESTWIALFVPASTPASVLARLNADTDAVLAEGDIRARLDQIGVLPVGGPPAAAEAYVHSEIRRWGEVVRSIGLRVD
jgi:tripartite-type tricarboxylate transporter receptor subunit TctC